MPAAHARGCRGRLVRLILALPLAFSVLSSSPTPAVAEEFLSCATSRHVLSTDPTWRAHLQGLLYRLTGDDPATFLRLTPQVTLHSSLHPNAFSTSRGVITVSTGLIEEVRSSDELAFVLAHELGHLALHRAERWHQFTGRRITSSELREREADNFARQLLAETGFEEGSGLALRERLSMGTISGYPLPLRVIHQMAHFASGPQPSRRPGR